MNSCHIGAIRTMLLLNALALDLASVPVGTNPRRAADVVEGVGWNPAILVVEDAVVEVMDAGVFEVREDVKLLVSELTLGVDDNLPSKPSALEFVLVCEEEPVLDMVLLPDETLELGDIVELDDVLDICDEDVNDDEDWLCCVVLPAIEKLLALPTLGVETMLRSEDAPATLAIPVPKCLEDIVDDLDDLGVFPVPVLELLTELPVGPPVGPRERPVGNEE